MSALVVALAAGKVMGDQTLVRLTPEQSRAMSLKTTVAVAATDTPLASLPATVTPALNGRVVAAVPFAAVVVRVDVLEGQAVGAGQPLAVLFSQDALKVSAELAQANAEVRMTEAAARLPAPWRAKVLSPKPGPKRRPPAPNRRALWPMNGVDCWPPRAAPVGVPANMC